MATLSEPLRVVEFFAGIGGLHYALQRSGVPHRVVQAFDVDDSAVRTYRHNLPRTPVSTKNIVSLQQADLQRLAADCWLLSPPCQPHTRQGLQLAESDGRAAALARLVDLLEAADPPLLPSSLLLENVVGFESSSTRTRLRAVLLGRGYSVRELWASPAQIGVPNQRTRYFLLASRRSVAPLAAAPAAPPAAAPSAAPAAPQPAAAAAAPPAAPAAAAPAESGGQSGGAAAALQRPPAAPVASFALLDSFTVLAAAALDEACAAGEKLPAPRGEVDAATQQACEPLSSYLLPHCGGDGGAEGGAEAEAMAGAAVAEHVLERYGAAMDLVSRGSRRSCCFTKNYSRYVKGTGSVLCEGAGGGAPPPREGEKSLETLRPLRPRFFLPREVANLHGFPPHFGFPPEVSTRKQYELLGNSLSVQVVATLLRYLLLPAGDGMAVEEQRRRGSEA